MPALSSTPPWISVWGARHRCTCPIRRASRGERQPRGLVGSFGRYHRCDGDPPGGSVDGDGKRVAPSFEWEFRSFVAVRVRRLAWLFRVSLGSPGSPLAPSLPLGRSRETGAG